MKLNHLKVFMHKHTLFVLINSDSYIAVLLKFYVTSRSPYFMTYCTLKFYIFIVNICNIRLKSTGDNVVAYHTKRCLI